jgi:type I restriction enzyme, S subunit
MREGWTYKELGNLCTIKGRIGFRGYTREDLVNEGQGAITLSPSNIIEDKLDLSKCSFISWFKYEESPEIMVFNGDIIYAKTASIGKVAIIDNLPEKATINPQFVVLKEIKCDNKYLYYALRSSFFKEQASSITRGVAIPTISQANLSLLKIPVPSLQEQNRIVAELDLLTEIIDKQKQQLKELDTLAQSIFYDMFGSVDNNTKNFMVKCLNEVFQLITDGTHQTPQYTDDILHGFKFLSAKDVVSGVIDWTRIKYIPESLHNELYKRLAPRRGDILLCKNGTTGICALVETDEVFDIYVSLALLRTEKEYNKKYLVYAINNPSTKSQFDDSLKGVGVPNLHLGEIKKTKILVPPIELQSSFAKKIESIESQKESINRSLAESQKLFDYTMDKYFG